MRDLVFFDTETTGLEPTRHEIIDIWARKMRPIMRDGRMVDLMLIREAGGLVAPVRIGAASPDALLINGYDQARWDRDARPWADVWPEVAPLFHGAMIVGSNPVYDLRMVWATHRRNGLVGATVPSESYILDTVGIAHPMVAQGELRSASLFNLCERFGVKVDRKQAHTARYDVLVTEQVYRHLVGM